MILRGDIEKTFVEHIVVPARRRQPTDLQVEEMRKSLRENGLLTPIGVRLAEDFVVDGHEWGNVYVLVYGATRLGRGLIIAQPETG
jgi:ParB-like chromosome segregation protein Spo0J